MCTRGGSADRWSDIDLTFGLVEGVSVNDVLADWTEGLAAELDPVDLFDVYVGSTIYRVFLLPGNLQVDLSFAPEAEFGALGPISSSCSGPRGSVAAVR